MPRFYAGFVVIMTIFTATLFLSIEPETMTIIKYVTALVTIVFFCLCGINIVNEWDRRPVTRFGKYRGEVGPGLWWVNPLLDCTLEDVNVYDDVMAIQIKNVQTKDNVPLSFQLVLTTKVENVRKSVVEISDWYDAVCEWAKASANGTIRAHELEQILGTGGSFSEQILSSLKSKVAVWGIAVKAIEIKDFKIEDEAIQAAIAMKARAKKEAEAELTRAAMQLQIAEKLNGAARAFDESGWKLKGMEVLLELCRSATNNTILIPTEFQSLAKIFSPKN